MTSKKTVVKVSKTKKEMKLRTMKKLVKTIPLGLTLSTIETVMI